ncbi:MAG: T9SS type A sorting domain-containing protein [candidate division Zixibacteria bacterium]
MSRHLGFLIFSLILFTGAGFAQAPDVSWTRTYGGTLREGAYDIERTSDGNYIVVGEIETSSYNTDVYLLKVNPDGDTLWTASFGNTNTDEYGRSVEETSDGGFIIGGYGGVSQENEVILIKTDSLGNFEWQSAFGPTPDNRGHAVCQTSDGGFIVAGQAWIIRGSFGSYDMYVIKTNAFGGFEWERFIGGESADYALGVCEAPNGDIVATGRTQTFGWDVFLVRLSPSGDSLWARGLGEGAQDDGSDIIALDDGSGFMFTGLHYDPSDGGSNAFLARADNDGDIVWWRNYGGDDEERGESLAATPDGGYVIGGMTATWQTGWNVYVVKTDSLGNEEWSHNIGGTGDDRGYGVICGIDGSIVVAGWTSSYGGGWLDVYLIQFEGTPVGVDDNEQYPFAPTATTLGQNYPNPFNASTEIAYVLPIDSHVTLEIFDLLGRRVGTLIDDYQQAGDYNIIWNADNYGTGIYLYKLRTGDITQTRKMVLLK